VRDLKWLGNGPYRVYKNRLKGGTLSVWQNKYNDAITGRAWLYPSSRILRRCPLGETRHRGRADHKVLGDDNIFLRVFTPTLPADPAKRHRRLSGGQHFVSARHLRHRNEIRQVH